MSARCVEECMSIFFLCVYVDVCCACVAVYGDEAVPVGPQGAV